MASFKIGNVTGSNNLFGDNNVVNNNYSSAQNSVSVLTQDEYFQMVSEIIELERISIDDYLEDRFEKFSSKNPKFIKILYKNIYKVICKVGGEDCDLLIENGDFVLGYGDIKLTGNPNNLHYATIWLHMKLVEQLSENNSIDLNVQIDTFERDFLFDNYDTPASVKKVQEIALQLKAVKESGFTWHELNDIIELKPKFAGMGLNLNALFSKFINRNE